MALVRAWLYGIAAFIAVTAAFCVAMVFAIAGPPSPSETADLEAASAVAMHELDDAARDAQARVCAQLSDESRAWAMCPEQIAAARPPPARASRPAPSRPTPVAAAPIAAPVTAAPRAASALLGEGAEASPRPHHAAARVHAGPARHRNGGAHRPHRARAPPPRLTVAHSAPSHPSPRPTPAIAAPPALRPAVEEGPPALTQPVSESERALLEGNDISESPPPAEDLPADDAEDPPKTDDKLPD